MVGDWWLPSSPARHSARVRDASCSGDWLRVRLDHSCATCKALRWPLCYGWSNLQTHYFSFGGTRVAKGSTGSLRCRRRTIGLVGDRDRGKTTTAVGRRSAPPAARIVGAASNSPGEEPDEKRPREMRRISWSTDCHDPAGSDGLADPPSASIGRSLEPAIIIKARAGRSCGAGADLLRQCALPRRRCGCASIRIK